MEKAKAKTLRKEKADQRTKANQVHGNGSGSLHHISTNNQPHVTATSVAEQVMWQPIVQPQSSLTEHATHLDNKGTCQPTAQVKAKEEDTKVVSHSTTGPTPHHGKVKVNPQESHHDSKAIVITVGNMATSGRTANNFG